MELSALAVRSVATQRNSMIPGSHMFAPYFIRLDKCLFNARRDTDGGNCFGLLIEGDDDDGNVFSLQAALGRTQRSDWWSIS